MGFGMKPLFEGTVANTETKYVGVPIWKGRIGLHIAWLDATSAATITLEYSSFPATDAPVDEAGSAWEWVDSGETITGPDGSAAGAVLVNLKDVHQLRARLKIVATADSDLIVRDGCPAT